LVGWAFGGVTGGVVARSKRSSRTMARGCAYAVADSRADAAKTTVPADFIKIDLCGMVRTVQ